MRKRLPGARRWTLGLVAVLAVLAFACTEDGGDGTGTPGDTDGGEDGGGGTGTPGDTDGGEDGGVQVPSQPATVGPVTGPGAMYVDPLEGGFPDDASVDAFGYVFDEYFLSGTAAGEPYQVRVQIAQPGDQGPAFSGHAIVEAIHPQGIPFIWNFTREYLMAEGHAAVNVSVFPNTVETLQDSNEARYADLRVAADETNDNRQIAFEHASDIYAQVGAWLKSDQTPLDGVKWLHMTGHSMSVGPVWQYMDTHHAQYRLENDGPIYDGFFPETTRTASRMGPFPKVDVPTVLLNSELEVEVVLVQEGIDYRRPDSDESGQQFRLYEVAGMPHNLSWMHPLLLDTVDIATTARERCVNPLNSFPYNPTVSMGLDHLVRWVEDDIAPPRAEPIEVTGTPGEPDAAIARDEHGNALGGVRSTTLDVPVATYLALNEPQDPSNDLSPGSCLVYGSQLDFSPEKLETLYGDRASYLDEVDARLDALVADGWYLEQFAPAARARAERVDGFDD